MRAWTLLFAVALVAPVLAQSEIRQLTRDGKRKEDLAWSPDGRQVAFSHYHARGKIGIGLMNADGSNVRLLSTERCERAPSWSPDGERLAFVKVTHSGTDGELDLYDMDLEGKDRRRLVTFPSKSFDNFPRWSPDGTRLLFTTTIDKTQEIYVCDKDGGNRKRLTSDPSLKQHPNWSPDGKLIIFAGAAEGSSDLWTMHPDGTNLRRLTTDSALETCPAWSPDGKRLAYVSTREGNPEIFVQALDAEGKLTGTATNVSKNPGYDFSPAWQPNGKGLSWVSDRAGRLDVFLTEP